MYFADRDPILFNISGCFLSVNLLNSLNTANKMKNLEICYLFFPQSFYWFCDIGPA